MHFVVASVTRHTTSGMLLSEPSSGLVADGDLQSTALQNFSRTNAQRLAKLPSKSSKLTFVVIQMRGTIAPSRGSWTSSVMALT